MVLLLAALCLSDGPAMVQAQHEERKLPSTMFSPPEPGQIVQIRNLHFVVADVTRGALPQGLVAEGLNHAYLLPASFNQLGERHGLA